MKPVHILFLPCFRTSATQNGVREGYAPNKKRNHSGFAGFHYRYLLLPVFVFVMSSFVSFAQLNAGIIGKSQCVTSGTVLSSTALGSIRGATGGTITWERANNSSFTGATTVSTGSQTYIELAAIVSDTWYRRVVTSGVTVVYSNVIRIAVVGAPKTDPTFTPTILALPEICQQTTSFSVGYTTGNSPDKYSIYWDATAAAAGFQDAIDGTLGDPGGTLIVAVPVNASANTYNGTLVAVITGTGCTVSNISAVKVNPLPTVVITAPSAVCSPGTIDLTSLSVTAGSTADTYTQWNNAAATSSLVNASSLTATGVYYIKGTIAATGCAVTKPVTATINPLPTVVVTSPAAVCSPGTIDLTSPSITSAGSMANLSYTQWNDAAATSTLANASAITATGSYYIKGTISATGCAVTKPVTATINPLPTVVVTNPAAVCSPGTIDLTSPSFTSVGSTANLSYTQWNDAAATSTLANASAITATGSYYIKGTISATGCAVTKPVTATINPLPTVVVTNPAAVCSPGTIDLTSLSVTAGSTADSYTQWNNAAATSSLANANSVTVTGVYYIKGTIPATGCGVVKPVTATINSLPTVVVTNPAAVCSPGTIDLTSPSLTSLGSTANLSYTQWNDAAATSTLANAGSITATGVYYIKGTIAATGCAVTKPVTATINSLPSVVVTAPAAICSPGTIDLTSPSITSLGSAANLSYTQWNNAAATSSLTNAGSITATGVYYIKGTITATGCAVTKPVSVTVNQPPDGILQNPSADYICHGSSLVLNASNAYSYQWYLNQQPIAGATAENYAATVAGNYTVRFISKEGCVKDAVNTIPLIELTKPVLQFKLNSSCAGSPIGFTNSSVFAASGTIKWQWDFGDGSSSNVLSPVYTYQNGGNYTITLTAGNASCSSLTESISLPVIIESPKLPIRYATVNAVGGKSIMLTARNAGNIYLWQPSAGLNDAALQSPTATLDKDMEYTITINSRAGCVVTDTLLVKVATDGYIYVGQGFTPNGDGVNDRCYPITVGVRSLTWFKIFNRWGNLVFQTNDATPQNGWDGKFNGKLQPAGIYQWVAEAIDGGGNRIKRTGAVLLIN